MSAPSVPNDVAGESLEDRTLLLLARLMEGGQEDEQTCKELDTLAKILSDDSADETRTKETRKALYTLIDTDCVETILGYLDMRQPPIVRGHGTLATSAYMKAAGDKGAEELTIFFQSKIKKATYDDFIVAFSVAAQLFPVIPDLISTLFLSEGFVPNLGPLMKRKWKSKKVERATLEMLNVACMNNQCREAIRMYCTEWLEEIVNDTPQSTLPATTPEQEHMTEEGSLPQLIHQELVRNLASVILAKLQVSDLTSTPHTWYVVLTDIRIKGCSINTCPWIRRTSTTSHDKHRRACQDIQDNAIVKVFPAEFNRGTGLCLVAACGQRKLSLRQKLSRKFGQRSERGSPEINCDIRRTECSR